ncbi:hypothetical protein [Nocardia sp. NPDC056000]|uniref:hypothetical protein n=1 Tax=Nocardia sp. NPDC056000 TaxID=3345674 RepID=UPI0035D9FB12
MNRLPPLASNGGIASAGDIGNVTPLQMQFRFRFDTRPCRISIQFDGLLRI